MILTTQEKPVPIIINPIDTTTEIDINPGKEAEAIHVEPLPEPQPITITVTRPEGSYQGPYVVTPSEEAQTLDTSGLIMSGNVTVGAIPSNYGKITYNGSVFTIQ